MNQTDDVRTLSMEAIRRRLEESTLATKGLIDFDSSGYGPSAVLKLWNYIDELVRDNRLMRLHINGTRLLSETELGRIRHFYHVDKKLEGIDNES